MVVSQCPPRRQGARECLATIEDISKTCLHPSVALPVYFAIDLNCLPLVDMQHCDMSAILAEIRSLRAEVRLVSGLRQEVDGLKDEIKSLRAEVRMVSSLSQDVDSLNDEMASLHI